MIEDARAAAVAAVADMAIWKRNTLPAVVAALAISPVHVVVDATNELTIVAEPKPPLSVIVGVDEVAPMDVISAATDVNSMRSPTFKAAGDLKDTTTFVAVAEAAPDWYKTRGLDGVEMKMLLAAKSATAASEFKVTPHEIPVVVIIGITRPLTVNVTLHGPAKSAFDVMMVILDAVEDSV